MRIRDGKLARSDRQPMHYMQVRQALKHLRRQCWTHPQSQDIFENLDEKYQRKRIAKSDFMVVGGREHLLKKGARKSRQTTGWANDLRHPETSLPH